MRVTDAEMVEMQERCLRVIHNNNASGSARALAHDLMRVTTLMQRQRVGRSKSAKAALRRQQTKELFDYLENEFK